MLERLALVGFLAGYSGPTRESYRTDLRLFTVWLTDRQVRLLEVQRTHIELYGRWLEEQGRARSTVGRRLSTLAGFYRYCEREAILERSPAAHVRRPKAGLRVPHPWVGPQRARRVLGGRCAVVEPGFTRWRRCWR